MINCILDHHGSVVLRMSTRIHCVRMVGLVLPAHCQRKVAVNTSDFFVDDKLFKRKDKI